MWPMSPPLTCSAAEAGSLCCWQDGQESERFHLCQIPVQAIYQSTKLVDELWMKIATFSLKTTVLPVHVPSFTSTIRVPCSGMGRP